MFREFVLNEGPEVTIFFGDHPFIEKLKTMNNLTKAQNKLIKGIDLNIPGQLTNYILPWNLFDVIKHFSNLPQQFVGSGSYYGFIEDNKILNYIYDSKSRNSFFLHAGEQFNRKRSESKYMGDTYQVYLWETEIQE